MGEPQEALLQRIEALEAEVTSLKAANVQEDATSIVAFSGDMDKLIASFIIATGSRAMGMRATMFFTFWGLMALKRESAYKGKSFHEKLVTAMMPGSAASAPTSRLNMGGAGPVFFRSLMAQKNVQSLPDLIELALDLEVDMFACQMSMGIMGITESELMPGIGYCGVSAYLEDAGRSSITLFI